MKWLGGMTSQQTVSMALEYALLNIRSVLKVITWVGTGIRLLSGISRVCVCVCVCTRACMHMLMFLCVWAAAVSWAVSVTEPTAEVGFWAWLPVTLSPSRAAEPREMASDNRSSGSLPSLTPVMRPETVGQDVCNIPIVPFFFSFSAFALKDYSSQQDFPFSRISLHNCYSCV